MIAARAAEAIEFSHKRHAAALKLPCTHCHTGALKAERAGFPSASVCRECHPAKGPKPFPVHHVYTLPDFVFFSHGTHAGAGVKCDACHGNVAAADFVTKESKLNMMWCVNCHKAAKANTTCTACHELSQ